MTKTAIIHARVSDRKQAEKEVSIPSQVEAGKKRAQELGAEVVHIFIEGTARSAWRGNRPELENAIRYCEVNQVDYFITWDTSRFSRNHIEGPINRHRLRSAGTFIEYITVKIDPETTDGFVLETIYQMKDELKSRDTSRDTRRGMIANAREGFWNGGRPPYGFQVVADINNPKRKRLAPSPDEAEVVKLICELKANKGLGAKTIARWLNEKGYTNRGKRWNKTVIGYLLRNEALIGRTVFGKKNKATGQQNDRDQWIIVDSHKPIISAGLWERVQTRLAQDGITTAGSPHSTYLFTGLLNCNECGSSMHITSAKGRYKRYWYYACSAAMKDKAHKIRRIPARELDAYLTEEICSHIINRSTLIDVINDLGKHCDNWESDKRKRRSAVLREIDAIQGKQAKLYEVLEQLGTDTPNLGDLAPRLRANANLIKDLEKRLAGIEGEPTPLFMVTPGDAEKVALILGGIIKRTDEPKKVRDFFGSFIESVQIESEVARICYSPTSLLSHGGAVLSKAVWLPETAALRTTYRESELPDHLAGRAASL